VVLVGFSVVVLTGTVVVVLGASGRTTMLPFVSTCTSQPWAQLDAAADVVLTSSQRPPKARNTTSMATVERRIRTRLDSGCRNAAASCGGFTTW
jgi:hypothetical protein